MAEEDGLTGKDMECGKVYHATREDGKEICFVAVATEERYAVYHKPYNEERFDVGTVKSFDITGVVLPSLNLALNDIGIHQSTIINEASEEQKTAFGFANIPNISQSGSFKPLENFYLAPKVNDDFKIDVERGGKITLPEDLELVNGALYKFYTNKFVQISQGEDEKLKLTMFNKEEPPIVGTGISYTDEKINEIGLLNAIKSFGPLTPANNAEIRNVADFLIEQSDTINLGLLTDGDKTPIDSKYVDQFRSEVEEWNKSLAVKQIDQNFSIDIDSSGRIIIPENFGIPNGALYKIPSVELEGNKLFIQISENQDSEIILTSFITDSSGNIIETDKSESSDSNIKSLFWTMKELGNPVLAEDKEVEEIANFLSTNNNTEGHALLTNANKTPISEKNIEKFLSLVDKHNKQIATEETNFSLSITDNTVSGDFGELQYGKLYRLNKELYQNNILIQLVAPRDEGGKPGFIVYKENGWLYYDAKPEKDDFANNLIEVIAERGGIRPATDANIKEIKDFLSTTIEKASEENKPRISRVLDALNSDDKPRIPFEIANELSEAATNKGITRSIVIDIDDEWNLGKRTRESIPEDLENGTIIIPSQVTPQALQQHRLLLSPSILGFFLLELQFFLVDYYLRVAKSLKKAKKVKRKAMTGGRISQKVVQLL